MRRTSLPVVVFLRGDHQVNEAKLNAAIGAADLRPMHEEEIRQTFGSAAGYLGPIGSEGCRHAGWRRRHGASSMTALVAGPTLSPGRIKEEYHLKNVTPGRDFTPDSYRRCA